MSTLTPSTSAVESQLVPVFPGQIGGLPAQVCDGRTLHTFLENGDKFADWISDRVEKYGFQEDQDFAIVSVKTETIRQYKNGERKGVAIRTDYHLCLDMAKELSMVENNDKGRQARRYFIDCERRALAAQRPTPISPEPPRLTFATLEQRAPLVNAVRRLVKVAEAKGRSLSYSDAHSIVNLKLGVEDVEHLSPEQIPQAMKLVGELLQTIVLEGEYIPKGEPDPIPIPETPEYISSSQEQTLSWCAYQVAQQMPFPKSISHAFYFRLRQVTGVPSPGKFEVKHLPILAQEIRRFYAVVEAFREVQYRAVKTIAKRLLRREEEAAPILAEIAREFDQAEKETDAELQSRIQPWIAREIAKISL